MQSSVTKNNNTYIIIGIVVLVLIIGGIAIWWFFFRKNITVAIDKKNVSLAVGDKYKFNVTVRGATNSNVNWTVSGDAGKIINGEFEAVESGSVTITATSVEDSSKKDTAVVTITPVTKNITVVIDEGLDVTVRTGIPKQFNATVTGSTGIEWTVSGLGSIDNDGLFMPGPDAGSAKVTATSKEDKNVRSTVNVTIVQANENITILINPKEVVIPNGQSYKFNVTINNANDQRVVWSVNNTLGKIDQNGLFTARGDIGQVAVKVMSVENDSKADTAVVTLVSFDDDMRCRGNGIVRCEKKGPTTSRGETYIPFDMFCADGKYIDILKISSNGTVNGIDAKCFGEPVGEFFGGNKDGLKRATTETTKDNPYGYQYHNIQTWYNDSTDAIGHIKITDNKGKTYAYGKTKDSPQSDLNCGPDGIITGIFGTHNDEYINTLGVQCGYR